MTKPLPNGEIIIVMIITAMKEENGKDKVTQMSAEEAGEGGRDEGNGELVGFSSS